MSLNLLHRFHKGVVEIGNHWAAYAAVVGIPGVFVAWFIKAMNPFSQTGWSWPEAVVLAFAAVLMFAFVAGLVMIGYRALRPLPVAQVADRADDAWKGEFQGQLKPVVSEIETMAGAVEALTAMFEGLHARVGELRGDRDATEAKAELAIAKGDAAQASADHANNKLNEREGVAETIDARINGLVEFADRMGNKVNEQGSEIAAVVKTLDRLLRAQFAMKTRDALDSLEAEIGKADARLYFPEGDGIGEVDWEEWKKIEAHWRRTVSLWVVRSKPFVEGELAARVSNTPQESFYGTWSFQDSDLPNADTIHRYKTFCIMRRNLTDLKEEVDRAVYEAAFG